MKTTETKWNMGNFNVALAVNVTPEVEGILLEAGLRAIGQSYTGVDKILGGFEMVDGKEVRRKNWKRGDVAFSQEAADKIAAGMGAMKVDGVFLGLQAKLTQKQGGQAFYKDEVYIAGLHESKGDLVPWLEAKVGYTGETHDPAGEYATPMLEAIRLYKLAMLS
jgi:hypothetical protein